MLTQRSGRVAISRRTISKSPETKQDQKRAVHIVFTATIELATMKRSDQRVIGICEAVEEAETIEKKFNETAAETNGTLTKAYTIRYGLPYTAPMMKQRLAS